MFPSCQHAVATRGDPATCGFVPRQVVHRTLMAAKDEGERLESWRKSSVLCQGIRLYVAIMQVIWILTAVLIVTLFIQYRQRLKR